MLAQLEDKAFLLSAAHVFDQCMDGVFVPMASEVIAPLENAPRVTGIPEGGTRDDDWIDVGFIRLTESEVLRIGAPNMMDLSEVNRAPVDVDHILFFLALGFPLKHHEINDSENTVQSKITSYTTHLADKRACEMANNEPRSNFLLRLDHRSISTNKSHGSPPSMNGMSGGGVWPVFFDPETGDIDVPFFGGLIIERPKGFASSISVTHGRLVNYFVNKFDD